MSESPQEKRRVELRKLLDELDRLAIEQRSIDLREPAALQQHEEKLQALRRRVALLTGRTELT